MVFVVGYPPTPLSPSRKGFFRNGDRVSVPQAFMGAPVGFGKRFPNRIRAGEAAIR